MKYNNKFYNNNKDFYKESVIQAFKEKLNEATTKLQKLKKESGLSEGFPTVADAKARAEKEKTTGKFDKKEVKPGVTQYTRKSSTFNDGGDDKDVKAAKKKAKANEGIADMAKKAGSALKKAGSKALDKLGHGSDEDMIKDLQKKTGMPQTGKKPMAVKNEAIKRIKEEPNEGNAFGKAVRDAKSSGAKQIKVAGKEYPVKEALKGGQKKLDVDKDGKLEKSDFAKLRAGSKVKEAAAKCNESPKGKSCPVHGLKECGMYETSHQAKTTMKHVKNPTAGEKKAAKDIKSGTAGYRDRVAMLKSAEKDGRLKEGSKPDFLDMDKDGDKKEPMKKAVADKKAGPKKGVNPFAKK